MGLGCHCIFYIMVLLRFHTICLYAKLIMSSLLIIFMFVILRFKIMASFSSLVAILNQNKLTRSHYVDWKRNLDIVLSAEEHKYVLSQPCTQGLRCNNLQSGSLHSWLCITTNILWRGCMYNKVLEYNLLIRPRVQLYLYSDIKYN